MAGDSIEVVSVNVAMPSILGHHAHGEPVTSGIAKRPTTAEVLELTTTNLAGDRQADLRAHGGPDKALYAYSADHWVAWEAELGRAFGPGSFGENLSLRSIDERDVCIGDQWQWGDAVLEVAQPRWPCFKLTMHVGSAEVGPRMRATGRTGWYLRVLRTGHVPTAGPIQVAQRHPDAITVADAHRTASDRRGEDPALRQRIKGLAPLAAEWQEILARHD